MIIDTFMFFNELDILEGRLEYLYDKVDKFVIVEADKTFTGKPKKLNFSENMSRYSKYLDKILYHPIKIDAATLNQNNPWKVESLQRNAIKQVLDFFDDSAVVIIGDVDEIPSHWALDTSINMLQQQPAVTLVYDAYIYNFGFKHKLIEGKFKNVLDGFAHNVITTNGIVKSKSPQAVRDERAYNENIYENFTQGWHLTYWGNEQTIKNKIEAYSHTERNTSELSSLENLANKKARGMMFTDSAESTLDQVDIRTIDPMIFSIFKKYSRPMPHYYDKIEGWFGEGDVDFYKRVVTDFNGPGHFVEVGSYKGKSTVCLAVEIFNQNKDIKIDCVDIWEPNLMYGDLTLQEFMYNISPVKDMINPIKMSSEEAAKLYPDQSIDFVFIDADHSYQAVKKDIMLWWPKVKKGGIIAGHDEYFPDVKEAVTKIFDTHSVVGSCWFCYKF